MAAKSQEKIIFGAALLVLIASGAWLALQQSKLNGLRKPKLIAGDQSAYVPAGIDAPTVSTSTWPTPPPQTRGPLWIYDVFTPPEIYYNEKTKEFSVTPPVSDKVDVVVEPPFGVELQQVKQDVFRLQLVGYVGNAGDYRGTFENEITGDTLLAKAGKKFPSLGLTVSSFDVKRNLVPAPDSMPIYETVATAVVVDDKTGEKITLTNKKRLIKGTPIGIFKASDTGQVFEQKAGTSFTVGDAHYTIDAITAEPDSAEVTKVSPASKTPVTKSLSVPPPPPPPASDAPKPDAAPAAPTALPATTSVFGN